jgi:hypothetical protein
MVANRVARDVMGAAPDGDRQIVGSGKAQGGLDVRLVPAAGDNGGAAIDHAIPNRAGAIVPGVAVGKNLACYRPAQLFDGHAEVG